MTRRRQAQIALARGGRLGEVADQQFPLLIHPSRHGDPAIRKLVRLMADETGADAFIRQQQASSAGSTRGQGSAPSTARRWCWSATATS